MKRILALTLAAICLLALTACTGSDTGTTTSSTTYTY